MEYQIAYDRKAMDYRKIFLVDQNGVKDVALASKYENDESSWKDTQVTETVDAFKNVQHNQVNSATLDQIDAIGETIFQKVQRAVKMYNPVPMFFNVVGQEYGKTLEASEVVGGKVYSYTYGGVRNVSSLKTKTYTISSAPQSVHFKVPVQQMKVGRYTMADFVFAASQAIIRHKIGLAFGVCDLAWAAGGSYATNGGGVAVTETVLSTALKTLGKYQGGITVVGAYDKIFPIGGFAGASTVGYSDREKEYINKNGVSQYYRGAELMPLQYNPDEVYGGEAYTTTNLYLFSNNKNYNRFVEVGGLERSTWIEPETSMFHFKIDFEDGAAIWKPQYGHRIYSVA